MNFIDNLLILASSYLCCKGLSGIWKEKHPDNKVVVDVDYTVKDTEESEVKP